VTADEAGWRVTRRDHASLNRRRAKAPSSRVGIASQSKICSTSPAVESRLGKSLDSPDHGIAGVIKLQKNGTRRKASGISPCAGRKEIAALN